VSTRSLILLVVTFLPAVCLAVLGAWSRRAAARDADPRRDRLAPCSASPNCVISLEGAGGVRLPPLRYTGTAPGAWRRLARLLETFPRARVVIATDRFLHVTFRSAAFGFVDDVEFLIDEAAGRIDFRSASRVGHFDFGVNRRRMAEIARRFDTGRD
jgi:uncharacterized protein (DUF1499 family)